MEILNSGSFVPLDNREKIDQLIFTARTLATEVSRAEGFQNSSQTNHQLGLEMWKGAEYVCRSHEEANIRNLFLGKFLERLREIEKERTVQTKPTQAPPVFTLSVRPPASAPVSVPPPQPPALQTVPEPPSQTETQDEYLGVIPADDRVDDQAENKRSSYADECVPEYDADIDAIVERLENEHPHPDADGSSGQLGMEPAQPAITETADAPVKETGTDDPITIEPSASSDVAANEGQPDVAESVESESIESVVLAEKEPYNLDACTVTAVIQMLPENSGSRKCIVSMRTHDFAPMVAVSEAGVREIIPHISAALSDALEQYRIDLPAKAAEKLKKEKPAARKQAKSGSKTAKATTVQSKATTNSETTFAVSAPNPETDQSQRAFFYIVGFQKNSQEKSIMEQKKEAPAAEPEAAENTSTVTVTEPKATIKMKGQEFELDAALAQEDKTLKVVLQPHFASIENANITREVKDGKLTVTIVKRAQHKGA